MNWSDEQLAIFERVENALLHPHGLVVEAYAGTGKTTTMVEAVQRFARSNVGKSVVMTAFNKKNATELQERVGDVAGAQASTLHSIGFSACRYGLKGVKVDANKGKNIARDICGGPDANWTNVMAVMKIASLAKGLLIDSSHVSALTSLVFEFDVSGDDVEPRDLAHFASIAMKRAARDKSTIDFDDMCWFPHIHNLRPYQHDLVIVDEAQDMNPAQLALAKASVRSGGRLIAVGDSRQAIYGWRGADSDFLRRMIEEANADTLRLSTTYRCGKAIVERAKKYVDGFRAHESNGEGVVRTGDSAEAGIGDFVLSRTNAPLLPKCLAYLRDGVPAYIQGRDVGATLISLVKLSEKAHARTSEDLVGWLEAWRAKQEEALVKAEASDDAFGVLADKVAILTTLADEYSTTERIKLALGELFDDGRSPEEYVTLSTVHRAKGLERDRVFVLLDTFRSKGDQEDNVMYVAYTRARHELVFC